MSRLRRAVRAAFVLAATGAAGADRWLEPPGTFPDGAPATRVTPADAAGFAGAAVDGRLRVRWTAPAPAETAAVHLRFSADPPGHWPSRHWRTVAMTWDGGAWAADVPVLTTAAPLIYFAEVRESGAGGWSTPMRLFDPAQTGMTPPPEAGWRFLAGFEDAFEGWELATGARNAPPLERASPGATGRGALAVTVPPGRASVAVNTTVLRGWMLLELGPAAALRLAARTDAGTGRLRVWLATGAGSPEFVRHEGPWTWEVGPAWRRFEAPFGAFRRLRPGEVDRVTFEFAGRAGQRLLLDDVELAPED